MFEVALVYSRNSFSFLLFSVFNKDVLTADEEEQFLIARGKMLGNIKFIGELGKLQMLHEGILHRCIKQLLEKKKKVPIHEMSENMECLCQIIRTVGKRLDHEKARVSTRALLLLSVSIYFN